MKLDRLSLILFVKLRSLGYVSDAQVIEALKSGKLKEELTSQELQEVREEFNL